MRTQLLERGLDGALFDVGDGRVLEGDVMNSLCRILASMEDAFVALERRGVNLKMHTERLDPETGKLPVYHVVHGRE